MAASRKVIRASSNSIRAAHRREVEEAARLADAAGESLREAQQALDPFPAVAHAGFLHDAAKEYAEARLVAAFVGDRPLPSPDALGISGQAWLTGLAEAASELRRHLLDRMRAGDLERAEQLLGVMDDVYAVLVTMDFPDALTGGLRRTTDGLRAVIERSRGDVTLTVSQARLQAAIERSSLRPDSGGAGS